MEAAILIMKKSLKIPKEQSESVNQRRKSSEIFSEMGMRIPLIKKIT